MQTFLKTKSKEKNLNDEKVIYVYDTTQKSVIYTHTYICVQIQDIKYYICDIKYYQTETEYIDYIDLMTKLNPTLICTCETHKRSSKAKIKK